jgi:predicted TPR repeat methyltransferase/thioredoxin-like negative regulator of GroEL
MTTLVATADPNALMRRASELIDAGRTGAAAPLLAALKGLLPPPTLRRLTARLMLREGRLDEAAEELDQAIIAAPNDVALLKQRAQLRLQLDDVPNATLDAANAVFFGREDAEAKALLGLTMTRLGRSDEAIQCLAEALASEPANAAFRIALARAYLISDAHTSATALLEAGVCLAPANQGLQEELILSLVRCGEFEKAVDAARRAVRHGAIGPCGFGLLGHALSSMNQHANAAEAYQEAYKLAPEDPYVRHMVAASGALPDGTRAPADYLRAVFDGYADRFEQHLIALGYRVPGLLRAMLLEAPAASEHGPSLDLGCGTGLMAVALGDLSIHPLTGVDISGRMLTHAAAKQTYASLVQSDLLSFIRQPGINWKLILAADVLCYMGPLGQIFSSIAERLLPDGRFIFSVELLSSQGPDASFCLGRNARYAHTECHVMDALSAAGLAADQVRYEIIRNEVGVPVRGLLVSASRSTRT